MSTTTYPNLIKIVEGDKARQAFADYRSFDADFTHFGQSEADMRLAFAAVFDLGNWKMPIEAHFPGGLTEDEMSVIEDAIVFYAGCVPAFHTLPSGRVVVAAEGYYMAIGA